MDVMTQGGGTDSLRIRARALVCVMRDVGCASRLVVNVQRRQCEGKARS